MSPEERTLLDELFARTRSAVDTPRDPQAEALINDAVRAQPHAPYFLAQAVILQDQALRAATDHAQDLERQLADLQARDHTQQVATGSSFLGGLFGSSRDAAQRPAEPQRGQTSGPWGGDHRNLYPAQQPSQPPVQSGPWGQATPSSGGGFLRGAMGTAAGVAGGMLLANSLGSLLGGGHGMFGGSTMSQPQEIIEENVVNNNYFGDDNGTTEAGTDPSDAGGFFSNADTGDDSGSPQDDSFDV